MKKFVAALSVLAGFIAFASFAFAQTYTPLAPLPIGPGGSEPATWTLSTYLSGAIKLLVASAGALAVVMLVIGGTQYVAAGINPSAKGDAKEHISNALIGLILVLTSYLILNSIDPKLVQFNLSLSPVAAVPMKAYTAPTVVKKVWGGSVVSGGAVNTTPVSVGGAVSVAAGSSLYVSANTPVVISSPAVIKHLDGTTTNVPLSGSSTTVKVLAGETLSFPSGSSAVTLPEGGNVAVVVGGVKKSGGETGSPIVTPPGGNTTEPTRSLAIFKGAIGSGTVVSSPAGINCGTNCAVWSPTNIVPAVAAFPAGSSVTITATGNPGWKFSAWGAGCFMDGFVGSICDSQPSFGSCTINLDKSKCISVTFESNGASNR